ncbi:MAG: phenylalanine--tRNA ligase subunit beta [Candidatus Omnitrophica bacterium]|nr:phenylalanine--tRNA ligase subunit beta [Candidatus Omnitrophota bacterium]
MKLSTLWLKDYVLLRSSIDTLAHKLTMAGIEVEAISKKGSEHCLEMEITPNRPDCLSVTGLAREVAAVFNKKFEPPKIRTIKYPKSKCKVTVEDKNDCGLYMATVIKNVEVKPSPSWITKRLQSVDLKPISNIVDITNFCLMEMGQPMHAFDCDKLIGGNVIVRRAKKGETLVTIDGVLRALDPSMLVIADTQRPVAIAGIMGGKETEVTAQTKNILLECAYFDPILIRRTVRSLGLSSDSSYRFERGVDIQRSANANNRAVKLILNEALGEIAQFNHIGQKTFKTSKPIRVGLDKVSRFLGAPLKAKDCKRILKTLGCQVQVKRKDVFEVIPPSFRKDLNADVDIIEEVARTIGYDQLPMSMPKVRATEIKEDPMVQQREKIRRELMGQGLSETVAFSLINRNVLQSVRYPIDEPLIKIKNPLSLDQEVMRPVMFPSLLSIAANNINKGQKNIRIFEIGKVYRPPAEESEMVSILLAGVLQDGWRIHEREYDLPDIKGILEVLLMSFGNSLELFSPCEPAFTFLQQGASQWIKSGNGKSTVGCWGEVDKDILKTMKIKNTKVFYAEINLRALISQAQQIKKFTPLCDYPGIQRDISLSVNENLKLADIVSCVKTSKPQHLQSIDFVEEYRGEKVESGRKGLTIALSYQSKHETLTDQQVQEVHDQICQQLVNQLDVIIR